LEEVAVPILKTVNTAVEISPTDYATPFYPQKFALTSPTSGGRSVGIVRSRTKATEFVCFVYLLTNVNMAALRIFNVEVRVMPQLQHYRGILKSVIYSLMFYLQCT
jgi:hypothetical protein